MPTPEKKRYKRRSKAVSKDKGELRVIPLGGLGEIGKNLTAFSFGEDIIVVDCGLKFPEDDMLGIDLVIPDAEYLVKNKNKIKAIFITHGHEDHIGALPFILPRLDVPLYCTRLAAGFIENKMVDAKSSYEPEYRIISAGEKVESGVFSVEFISVCHSIPDALALAIKTPFGTIVHTGDFKFDPTPIDNIGTDFNTFAKLGEEGVLLLLSDSTNIDRVGVTPSERTVGQTFERLFRLHKDRRIVIATFASNIHRAQQVINTAVRFNRKVVLNGRSMFSNIDLAQELEYVDVPEGVIITSQEAEMLPANRVVVLTTGSQGEPFSGLVLMSKGTHRMIKLGAKDLVIISATPIPGNEKLVNNTINRLFALGCEVIYEKSDNIHVSGHASREELTILLNMVKPRYFMPVHGEYRHLVHHADLAREMGVPSKNIFILQNGDVLKFKSPNRAELGESVQSGAILIDGVALGSLEGSILRERRELSENGLVVISVVLDEYSQLLSPVQIQTKGSVFSFEDRETFYKLEDAVNRAIQQFERAPGAKQDALPTEIRKRVREVFGRSSRNYPTIVPMITRI